MQLLSLVPLCLAVAGLVSAHLVKLFRQANDPKGVPGPFLIPYIGRIHDLPIQYMWLKFKEWADKYAVDGFYRTEMLGAKFLVVSDEKVAEDLLVKKAKTNSDRPEIRSLIDSKSSFGSMEYLPLMGKNGKCYSCACKFGAKTVRILGSTKTTCTWLFNRGGKCSVLRPDVPRVETLASQVD